MVIKKIQRSDETLNKDLDNFPRMKKLTTEDYR